MHVPNQLDRTWLLAVSRPPFMSLQDHRPFIRAPVVAPKHHGVLAFNAVSREVDTVRFNRLQHFIVLKEQKDLPGRCVPGTKPCIVSRLVIRSPACGMPVPDAFKLAAQSGHRYQPALEGIQDCPAQQLLSTF